MVVWGENISLAPSHSPMEGASNTPALQIRKLSPEMMDKPLAQAHTESEAVELGLALTSGCFQSLCFSPRSPSLPRPPPPCPWQGLSCSFRLEQRAGAKATSEFRL